MVEVDFRPYASAGIGFDVSHIGDAVSGFIGEVHLPVPWQGAIYLEYASSRAIRRVGRAIADSHRHEDHVNPYLRLSPCPYENLKFSGA